MDRVNSPDSAVHATRDDLWIGVLRLHVRDCARVAGEGEDICSSPHVPDLPTNKQSHARIRSRNSLERWRLGLPCREYRELGGLCARGQVSRLPSARLVAHTLMSRPQKSGRDSA